MDLNLKNLAILHSMGKITDEDVKKALQMIEVPIQKREGDETWFEGNQNNTVAAVQSLINNKISQTDFTKFMSLISEV